MNGLRVFVYAVKPAYIDIHLAKKLSANKLRQAWNKGNLAVVLIFGNQQFATGEPQLLGGPAPGFQTRFGIVVTDPSLDLKAGDEVTIALVVDWDEAQRVG